MSTSIESSDTGAGPALLKVRDMTIRRADAGAEGTIISRLDLDLLAGESIGIVGESGSGKSMTAKALTGLLPEGLVATGSAMFGTQELLGLSEKQWRSIRGRRIGLVMQDPFTMLNPVMRCGQILAESILPDRKLSRSALRAESIRRLAEVGITDESVIDRYPFQLSGGMRQRVGIAAALARDPEVLIADEPSTALDAVTQQEVLALIKSIQRARGMGLILITHDLRVAFATCDRVQVLYAGSSLEVGNAAAIQAEPLHPYTLGLLLSEPAADRRVKELVAIPGSVPRAGAVLDQCAFAGRCRWAAPSCTQGVPELTRIEEGRHTRCARVTEIRSVMAEQRAGATQPVLPYTGARSGDVLVEFHDVVKAFSGFHAVDGVSLSVRSEESVGIVGQSGSGKTTVARMLVGLESPTSGDIVIDGVSVKDWDKLASRDRRRLRKMVQTVFQDPYSSLNPMRSIGWALEEAITTHRRGTSKGVREEVRTLLESVGLPASYAQRRPEGLSGGERQRIAIARAIAVGPKVLICDEPVSALDMSVQAQIMNLLDRIRVERGISTLFITHDLAIVRQAADYLYVMNRGKVVESGPTDIVLDDPADAYTEHLLKSVPQAGGAWLEPHSGVLMPIRSRAAS